MKLYVTQTRGVTFVPKYVWLFLILSLILQCVWHFYFTHIEAKREYLPESIKAPVIRLLTLDDAITASKLSMLWLQAFDNQPGISISLNELNYDRVIDWLNLILELDNKTQYPLLAAIRFYAEVQNVEKQRKMIDYVTKKFLENPNERWSSMTHAVYIAKHRIKDIELALDCAKILRQFAKGDNVPYWAKQMEIFILEDMGELESAMVLIGALLESGELKDKHQIKFLSQRLDELKLRQE